MRFKLWLIFIVFSSFTFADTIYVAVASNLVHAIKPLKKEFYKKYPEIKVKVIIGSSGKLTAQIRHGAPFDLFLSADMIYPKSLYEDGITLQAPVVYAKGTLVLLSKVKRDYSKEMEVLLTSPSLKKIAIANPKTAPYGKATVEALKKLKLYEKLKKKFVYAESISQTLIYATRVADMAIVAKSALFAPVMHMYQKNKHWIDVPCELYVPLKQGMVLLKHSKKSAKSIAFYDFMLSPKAKEILKSFGYKVD